MLFIMSGSLDLQIGDALQIQFMQDDGHRARASVRVIGLLPKASLLVTHPAQDGRALPVRENQIFVARSFSRDAAESFSCRVLRVCNEPYAYLHLSFPTRREQVTVRSSRRVSVLLSARVHRERAGGVWSIPMAAIVSNLSAGGAMIETAEALGEIGARLLVGLNLQIDSLPEQALLLPAELRTIYDAGADSERQRYGVQFVGLDAAAQMTLRAFVYEQMLGHER